MKVVMGRIYLILEAKVVIVGVVGGFFLGPFAGLHRAPHAS